MTGIIKSRSDVILAARCSATILGKSRQGCNGMEWFARLLHTQGHSTRLHNLFIYQDFMPTAFALPASSAPRQSFMCNLTDTIMTAKIKQITPLLLVTNLERAIQFYTEQLGFTLDFRYDDFYAGIEKDGHPVHLKMVDQPAGGGILRRNDEDICLLFSVDDIAGVFREISEKTINIVQPLREMPYGKEFYISDPDGNLIAFIDNFE
jgi:predicted enzyme related to lactoylglutathione lyase